MFRGLVSLATFFLLPAVACNASGKNGHANSPTTSTLELLETEVLRLPASEHVVGGRFLTARAFVYWTPTAVRLFEKGLRSSLVVCGRVVDTPRAVALSPDGTHLEILDRSGVVRSLPAGRCYRRITVSGSRSVASGAITPFGWVWIQDTVGGRPAIAAEVAGIAQRATKALPEPLNERRPLPRLFSSGNMLTLAMPEHPFAWTAVSSDTIVASGGPPPSFLEGRSTAVTPPGSSEPRWMTTGLVYLGPAFLQVVADASSDRRALFLFDAAGTFLRQTELAFPFGILDADRREQLLLAVRRPDSLELVVYSWSWRAR